MQEIQQSQYVCRNQRCISKWRFKQPLKGQTDPIISLTHQIIYVQTLLSISTCKKILKCIMRSQKNEKSEGSQDLAGEPLNVLQRAKEWLFHRNYVLSTSIKLSFPPAIILFVIEQMQKFAIVSRLNSNPTISMSPEMQYINTLSKYLLLEIAPVDDSLSSIISGILLSCQLVLLFCYLYPFTSTVVNQMISKFVVTGIQMVFTIPSIIQSSNCVVNGVHIQMNIILYLLSMSNNLIFETMQFQCSFQRENQNVLVRKTRPITVRLFSLGMATLFPILTKLMYPTSFLLYIIIVLIIEIYKWGFYLRTFIYFHELFMNLKGIMLSITISTNLCYLAIYIMDNAIIAQNVLLFISTFSIFLSNFFVVFRNHIVKDTVINKSLKSEDEISLYCVFYWHCYRHIAEKKNELYLSSLLKKHMNECVDPTCCCKNRNVLYDSNLKIFGNPKSQPHFDKVFIRHYIRKLLNDGYDQFSKSSGLAFLLSNYNIEILEMITQTMELIRKLTKMEQKRQLIFTEQFLLYCLRKKTSEKILLINHKRGNVDLQSVKIFDEQLIILNDNLRNSVKMYYTLWKQLQQLHFNEAALLDICKQTLELMFSMQRTYKELKGINTESTELRTIMLFYSRLILHDIHLLSQIKKDIKLSHERNVILSSLEVNNIQLFGTKTISLIAHQNSKIKWSSKNAHNIFEYPRSEFHNLTVKHLMPKYFAEHHDSYVQRWKDTGHHIKLNKTTYLWGSTRDGHCFSLLMFVKVIPLPHEQEYAFFACLEKIDDQNQIICSQHGEIYGSGKLFTRILNLTPKFIQEYRTNLQIFMPFTFDYFLEYFYPHMAKLKTVKRSQQIRREGYFPDNLQHVMQELSADRVLFLRKNKDSESFQKDYLNFIRQKMQQLTCNVNGQYASFMMSSFKVPAFQRDKKEIIVLKISNAKKDNIEKYYSELEKMINKLQALAEEDMNKKTKNFVLKKNKSDFFRAFLNPKRVKKLLQKEQQDKRQEKTKKGVESNNDLGKHPQGKTTAMVVAHRKKLALGAQYEIKNERVRYNLWKLKKMLLQQGVISRYTYNLLIGKNTGQLDSLKNLGSHRQDLETGKTIDNYDERNASEEDRQSFDENSEGELDANKQNDNETFNSASSSATFISMTNHVKMFKMKLRSLNTPFPLWLLNIMLLLIVASGMGGLIYSAISNSNNLDYGIKQFQNNQDANIILDSLIMGQMNINNINYNETNPYYQMQKHYLINQITTLFSSQMYNRAIYKKIDPEILSYLKIKVIDVQVLQTREFIEQIMNQIVQDNFIHVQKYFMGCINSIIDHSNNNIFFSRVINYIFKTFLIYLIAAILLFFITIPIVYKIQIKIQEIYELLSKISPNEKQRYFKHFQSLQDEFKKNEEIEFTELGNMLTIFQNRIKNYKAITRGAMTQSQLRSEKQKKEKEPVTQQSIISTDKSIYMKIVITFMVLICTILANYLYLSYIHSNFALANLHFTQVFNQKTLLTFRISECYYEMLGYKHQAPSYSQHLQLVAALYDTYHVEEVSQTYKKALLFFTTDKVCSLLGDKLNKQQLQLCQRLNNDTFTHGGIDNLYYSQRKLEQRLAEYYISRNNTPNDQSYLGYPDYYNSQEFYQLSSGYFYSTMMIFKVYSQIFDQMTLFVNSYKQRLYVATYASLALFIVFLALWIYSYLKLAENASYINAFLLLIPFDVLSQNPYIKLYIRNQFDYKSANY